MIAESNAIGTIKHMGLQGSYREYGLGNLMTKLLPSEWDVGSGQIQNSEGEQSCETDLLIFNKQALPPLMFNSNSGVFPIESCDYVFEVKTTSTAKEIQTTIKKFDKLNTLKSLSKSPLKVYFAFNSNVKNEFERYKKHDGNYATNPSIPILCIVGQGYWWFQRQYDEYGKLEYSYWNYIKADGQNYEVTCLLAGIINTLNDKYPPFGWYLLEKGKPEVVSKIEHF